MSSTSRPRAGLAALAVVLLTGGTVLSGCGVSDERPRPGAAAQVDDVRISADLVDGAVTDACTYFTSVDNEPFPRSIALQQFVSSLVNQSAIEQLMDETGATLDGNKNYQSDVADLDTQLADIPADVRDNVGLLRRAQIVVSYGTYAVGDAEFTASGEVPGTAAEVTERGQAALTTWIAEHEIDINPIYQLAVVDGVIVVDDEGTSVAQSDFAQAGLLDVLSQDEATVAALTAKVSAKAAQLPADQLCGG